MDEMLHRVPALERAEIRQMVNGPEAFTPDVHSIVGEAPEVSCILYLNDHWQISDCSIRIVVCCGFTQTVIHLFGYLHY